MTFIQKLMIRGIRSFSPRESNTLEFCSPLTLIVGPNGSGKTTIIESLRYAATGSLPPNSRGGAFVYDPRIALETEVRAQVRMLFTNTSNKPMVCTRTLQLTQRQGRAEQKTLESVLESGGGDGDGVSISGRGSDVDAEVPQQLGVSSSVIDNVIFCHQEEGTWPFSEPVVVKKRLDEIFASTRYSKALEGLKSSKKECVCDIRVKKQELDFLYKMKERRSEMEDRIGKHREGIRRNEVKLEAYESEIMRCNEVVVEIRREMEKMGSVEQQARQLEDEYARLSQEVGEFKGDVVEAGEAERVLNGDGVSHAEREYERAKEEAERLERRFREVSEERARYVEHKGELDGLLSEISVRAQRLRDAERIRAEDVEFLERELRVKEGFRETALSVFSKVECDISSRREEIRQLGDRLAGLVEERRRNAAMVREKMEMIKRYEELEDDGSVDVSVSYEDEIERLRCEMEKDSEMRVLEEQLEEYQRRLNKAFCVAEKNFGLEQLRQRRRGIEKILSGVDVSLLRERQLEQKRSVEEKKKRIREMEREIGMKKAMEIQRRNEMERIKEGVRTKMIELSSVCKENEDLGVRGMPDVGQVPCVGRYSLEEIEDAVRIGRMLFGMEDVVEDMEGLLEFEGLYDKKGLSSQMEEMDRMMKGSDGVLDTYREILDGGVKRHECPVCNRMLSLSEEERFRDNLESVIDGMPDRRRETVERKKRMDEMMRVVEGANNRIEYRNRMRGEVIELLGKYRPGCSSRESVEALEGMELDMLDEMEGLRKTEFYMGVVEELCSINERLVDSESGECVQELLHMVDGIKKMYEDKREWMGQQCERMSKLRRKQEMVEGVREIRRKIHLREEAREAVRMIEEKDVKMEVERMEEEMRRRMGKVEKMQEVFSRRRIDVEMRIEGVWNKEREMERLRGEIEELNRRAKEFLRMECSPEARDEGRFEEIRKEVVAGRNREFEARQRMWGEREARKHAEECMKYHRSIRRMEEIRRELEETDVGYLNVLREKERLLEEKRTKLVSQKSLVLGECKQIAVGVKSLQAEMDRDYSRVVEDYNRCVIETRTLELCLQDLDKYIQALDKAIVDFHSFKLEEVNVMLKDLWTRTYKGNDVDWIEIKAESVGQKTYSYRVVLVRNGVELDMRSRSSAGQRMIASILIRLALADSFASKCNILTLDEPTTNLDRENVESLALTLSRIVSRHRGSRSFQLIVITHDEDFVRLLHRDVPEYFYRLSRNENGDSAVARHSVYTAGGMQ